MLDVIHSEEQYEESKDELKLQLLAKVQSINQ
jgi:hypothetical protein